MFVPRYIGYMGFQFLENGCERGTLFLFYEVIEEKWGGALLFGNGINVVLFQDSVTILCN